MDSQLHFEPYVQVLDLTSSSVMIGWGGFYFWRSWDRQAWSLIHDDRLPALGLERTSTIGAAAEPYGKAMVFVFDSRGQVVAQASTESANYVLINDLQPDCVYTYNVIVNGHDFTGGVRHDCTYDSEGILIGILPSNKKYDLRFRTYPSSDQSVQVDFAVLGDYGIQKPDGRSQLDVARALLEAVERLGLRMVLITGDNLSGYPKQKGTSAEDGGWFYSFYQPYRDVIAQVPFYPTTGYHDTQESGFLADKAKLVDKFYLTERLSRGDYGENCSLYPGIFYRFSCGKSVQFVCLDSSRVGKRRGRLTSLPDYKNFLRRTLDLCGHSAHVPDWYIVLNHHPPFSAGRTYTNDDSTLDSVVPFVEQARFKHGCGCIVLSGHEHNFQYSHVNGVDYIISGSGGKTRHTPSLGLSEAQTRTRTTELHFLAVRMLPAGVVVLPMTLGENRKLREVCLTNSAGEATDSPILLTKAN